MKSGVWVPPVPLWEVASLQRRVWRVNLWQRLQLGSQRPVLCFSVSHCERRLWVCSEMERRAKEGAKEKLSPVSSCHAQLSLLFLSSSPCQMLLWQKGYSPWISIIAFNIP